MSEEMSTHESWCCSDCMSLLCNGETPPELDEEETAAWLARIPDFPRVTVGRATEVCGCDDWDTDDHRYYCEHDDFSWSACDVCGSTLGGERHAVTFWHTTRDVDAVLGAYVECALWSSLDYRGQDDEEPAPFDDWATVDDLAPETLADMRADVEAFVYTTDGIPGSSWWTDEQLGHDFWLTRNGHGAGFWDRHYGDTPEARAGDALTAVCKPYGSVDLYTGGDGRIYA